LNLAGFSHCKKARCRLFLVLSATAAMALQPRFHHALAGEYAVVAGNVNAARLIHADADPENWLTYGRTYSEQRFSPLKQVNDRNIGELRLAWHFDLDTHRGQEATPLVVDGVMYFTSAWSKVFAVNAATGQLIWKYDPRVPPEWAINACCDVVNRGVAVWKGKVFVGTLDGRLIALDAATGNPFWETLTIDRHFRYTITGAPRVAKGKVFIGNAGGETGVRGYVSAYDARTGKMVWRFYTVPGDPSLPFENPILAKAAKTWTGQWWKFGGGAPVWDSIEYDPELDLLFIGTGNGVPWDSRLRSPQGGDNLFACSIVALNPDTGDYVWHYQEDPSDVWDFDSDGQMILVDLPFEAQTRKLLLHAPKNGFFYVLDRATGTLLSAKPFTKTTWATEIDMKTGRPVEASNARYSGGAPVPIAPGPSGAHTWNPMSYSPLTGLVYIPVNETAFPFKAAEGFGMKALAPNYGIDALTTAMPEDPKIKKAILDSTKGRLVAWDPIRQTEAWGAERIGPSNGGTLATGGNLVFQGTAAGDFEAFRADTGERLWSQRANTGVIAGPVSYSVNNEQYIAVLAGWGGVFALASGEVSLKSGKVGHVGRMLAFKLGGKDALPTEPQVQEVALNPPPSTAGAAEIRKGEGLYQQYCAQCHGDFAVSGQVLPDLRYSNALSGDVWFEIVDRGSLKSRGMVSFASELSHQDQAAIRSYVTFRANQSKPTASGTTAMAPDDH
jgi:quinohemoprotein ethanol dehydrogenase